VVILLSTQRKSQTLQLSTWVSHWKLTSYKHTHLTLVTRYINCLNTATHTHTYLVKT